MIAQNLSFHLRQTRQAVYHLLRGFRGLAGIHVADETERHAFFLVDFSRYQKNLGQLAEQANAQRVQVVLTTDKRLSPATRHAAEVLAVPIDNGTVWESYTAALAVTEALVTRIAEQTRDRTRARIKAWDAVRNTYSRGDT